MRKLLSFAVILSLLLTFAFPVAQAGTITQKVQAAINKIDYITAGEFVTSLLIGAKVKPDKPLDYWAKAVKMGLIPAEVKKDKPLTRAQASYIVWKLISTDEKLRTANIPVEVRKVPPTEAFMRGICFFGGAYNDFDTIHGYDLNEFIQGYQLLIMEYKYANGRSEIKYVWDRYKGVSLAPGTYEYIDEPFKRILEEFKKKYPDKIVYAPRPYQKGWLFAIDPYYEAKKLKYSISVKDPENGGKIYTYHMPGMVLFDIRYRYKRVEQLGVPLTRRDFAFISDIYHSSGQTKFYGGLAQYDIREHPYFNMYFEDYLMNYPRKYPLDHTRFAYYCKDYSKIPQLYREAMLRLADLGIITPEQSAFYISVYYFNPAKMLTRQEAVMMIARVFDKSKRDVLDEIRVKSSDYWIPKNEVGLGKWLIYSEEKKRYNAYAGDEFSIGILPAQPVMVVRIQEPKAMSFARIAIRNYPNDYYEWFLSGGSTEVCSAYSASFNSINVEVLMYDEAEMTGLFEWENKKNIALTYVPLAYREQFKKDMQKYTAKYLVSNNIRLIIQYGDVYVRYNCWLFDKSVVRYEFFPTKPTFWGNNKFIVAKPNPKYTN